MVGLENELVDSYVRGDLSESEKQEFEQGYLTSAASRKNLQFAKVLPPIQPKRNGKIGVTGLPRIAERSSPPLPAISWPARVAFAALAVIAVVSISWMAVVNQRLHHEIDQIRGQQAGLQREETELRQKLAELSAQLLGADRKRTYGHPDPMSLLWLWPRPGQEYRGRKSCCFSRDPAGNSLSALHGAQRLSQL